MKDLMPQLDGSIMPQAEFLQDLYYLALARYDLARKYATNKTVLEVGSGAGYGAAVLATRAKKVYGIDTCPESIVQSQQKYKQPNLIFRVADVTALDFGANFFDLITAFEVIEHIKDYPQAIKEIYRVLKPGGLLIISTPNKAIYSPGAKKPFYPFHFKEFELNDLRNAFRDFTIVEILGQFIKGKKSLIYSPWNPKRIIRIIFANLPFHVKLLIMKGYLAIFAWLYQSKLLRPQPIKPSDIYFGKNFSQSRSFIIIIRKPRMPKGDYAQGRPKGKNV